MQCARSDSNSGFTALCRLKINHNENAEGVSALKKHPVSGVLHSLQDVLILHFVFRYLSNWSMGIGHNKVGT